MDITPQPRNSSFYIRRVVGILLLLGLSATFFYSAYTKSGVIVNPYPVKTATQIVKINKYSKWMTPIVLVENIFVETPTSDNSFDGFQWTFLDLGINSIFVTGVIARIFIGLELMLALFLLFRIFLRKFTYPAVIAILSVFIIYLTIVIIKQGNTGNCGCFGNQIAMKPLTAIIKNIVMIGITVLLMYIYPAKPFKYQEYLSMGLALIAFSTPFLVNFMYTGTQPAPYTQTLNLDPLYHDGPAPSVDLRAGKHIIAFMSLTCPHCKKAAYLLHIIHRQHPDIPMFLVLNGPESYEQKFFDETHAENVPHMYFKNTADFIKIAGPSVPSILWVDNGRSEYKSVYAYYQLDPEFMEKWLKSASPVADSLNVNHN